MRPRSACCPQMSADGPRNIPRASLNGSRQRRSMRSITLAPRRAVVAAPDRPAYALVRTMARHRTTGAGSGAGRTQLIDATAIHCNPSSALNLANAKPRLRPLHLVVRETEFCGLRLAGDFGRRTQENSRNSVRRPCFASLTRRNYGGYCRPGNRVGLSGLHGGGCRDRTDDHRSLASLQNEAACRGFSARNDLSQRMSKSLAGKPKALTMNRYLQCPIVRRLSQPRSPIWQSHQPTRRRERPCGGLQSQRPDHP